MKKKSQRRLLRYS